MTRTLCLLIVLTLTACGLRRDVRVQFETTEPLRVMVLPFAQLDNGEIVEEEARLFIDGIPLISSELAENPTELLRQMVQSELSKTGLDVIAPYLINIELPHHGFGYPDGSFALKKLYAADSKDLCQHFLDCDAVLYGWITEWDRSYYGIQTVNSVGLKLKLVSARSSKTLYEVEVSDGDGRGVSGGPTGFSDIVLEPLKGLDSKNIEKVARRVAEEAIKPLHTSNRAAFLDTPPPQLYAVAHTPTHVQSRNNDSLLVLAFAEADKQMFFSIGSAVEDFPMFEVEPNHYVGQYSPLPGERINNQVIKATIVDAQGRRTEQFSASGLLSIQ